VLKKIKKIIKGIPNKKNFINRALLFSFLNYSQAGISFLITILLARNIAKNEFGEYSYLIALTNILIVVMQFGTDKTLVRDLVQKPNSNNTLWSASIVWFLTGIFTIVSIYLWFSNSVSYNQVSGLLLIFLLIGFLKGMTPILWFDFKRVMNLHAFFSVIERIIYLSLIVLLFYVFEQPKLFYIAISIFTSRLLLFLYEWSYIIKNVPLKFEESIKNIKNILKNNYFVWFASIGNLAMTHFNQVILKEYTNTIQLAYYGLAFQFIMLLRLFQSQFLRLISPKIAVVTKKKVKISYTFF